MTMLPQRECEQCFGPFRGPARQRWCSAVCRREYLLDESRTQGVITALLGTAPPKQMARARVEHDAAGRVVRKFCAGCDAEFPLERNGRDQITSRAFCDRCRATKLARYNRPTKPPPGTPRCAGCLAYVGLEFGTITHLIDGVCPPCHAWRQKVAERARREAAARVARLPLYVALRAEAGR